MVSFSIPNHFKTLQTVRTPKQYVGTVKFDYKKSFNADENIFQKIIDTAEMIWEIK